MSYTTIEAFVRNEEAGNATTLIVVNKASLAGVVGTLGDLAQRCCTANGFNGEAGQFIGFPADEAGGAGDAGRLQSRRWHPCVGIAASSPARG